MVLCKFFLLLASPIEAAQFVRARVCDIGQVVSRVSAAWNILTGARRTITAYFLLFMGGGTMTNIFGFKWLKSPSHFQGFLIVTYLLLRMRVIHLKITLRRKLSSAEWSGYRAVLDNRVSFY